MSVRDLSRRGLLAGSAALMAEACASSTGEVSGVGALVEETRRFARPPRAGGLPYPGTTGLRVLPNISDEYAQENAVRARDWLRRAKALRSHALLAEQETLDVLVWDLERDLALAPFHWLEFPLGPYASHLNVLRAVLLDAAADAEGGEASFLSLWATTPAFVDQIGVKLRGQVARGRLVHEIEARRAAASVRAIMRDPLVWAGAPNWSNPVARAEAERVTRESFAPALERLMGVIEREYLPNCSQESTLGRGDDGQAYYRELLHLRVGAPLDPVLEHEHALDELAAVDAELAERRRELGVSLDASAFHDELMRDPRWIARDEQHVRELLMSVVERVSPLLDRWFVRVPATPGDVAPMPHALRATLLNGYYQPPTHAAPRGTYFFNPSHLETKSWVWAAPLMIHELYPGHHLQQAKLFENLGLDEYRRAFFVSGFAEGWGEYARTLAEEAGFFESDAWGAYASRLLDRRFLISAAVESGMSVKGWTPDRASEYVDTDPLTQPPDRRQLLSAYQILQGNGFSYWKGRREFLALRAAADNAVRPFDLRAFHERILSGGCVPFSVLRQRAGAAAHAPG